MCVCVCERERERERGRERQIDRWTDIDSLSCGFLLGLNNLRHIPAGHRLQRSACPDKRVLVHRGQEWGLGTGC